MPGETLSRRRGSAEPTAPVARVAPVVQPEANLQEESFAATSAPAVETPEALAPISEHDVPASPVAEPVEETVEEVEEVHEYEPEEASASHRVETPRSEFRFSAPVEEEVEIEEEEQSPESAAQA